MLDAIAGAASPRDYLAGLAAPLGPVRVGVTSATLPGVDLDPAVAAAFDEVLPVLRALGMTMVDVSLPAFAATVAATMLTLYTEAFHLHEATLRERWDDYGRSTRQRIASGAFSTGAELVRARWQREDTRHRLDRLFDDVDVMVSPAMTVPAPRLGPEERLDRNVTGRAAGALRYWNATGCPALVVPMGLSSDGLPLSLQLAARHGNESLLLRIGVALQRETDWHRREPPPAGGSAAAPAAVDAPRPPSDGDADVVAAVAALDRLDIHPGADRADLGSAYAAYRADVETLLAQAPAHRLAAVAP